MDAQKQANLKANGWRVGDAADFLELSPEEMTYIEMKLALASYLRQQRVNKHLTQTELAALLRSSQSRVAKLEAGDSSVSLDLLIRSLLTLGTTPTDLAKILEGKAELPTAI